jgi:hypothetical protein
MIPIDRALLTRKDVAGMLEVSPDFVRRNEVTLGLDKAKVTIGKKLVRYRRRAVEAVLAGAGILPRPPR